MVPLMKFKWQHNFMIILFFNMFILGKSDLPVHCLAVDVEGIWLFHMGDNTSDKDLKCGHDRPDHNIDHIEKNVENIFKKKYETIMKLERPDLVLSVVTNKQIGKWTMVFDEGFELQVDGQVFFTFYKYEQTTKFVPKNTDTYETPGYKSLCDKTFVGWYHKSIGENYGCFYAEKISSSKLTQYNLTAFENYNVFKYNKLPLKTTMNSKVKRTTTKNEASSLSDFTDLLKEQSEDIVNPFDNLEDKKEEQSDPKTYVDFIKSLSKDSGNYNNIPHLDIYFMDTMKSEEKEGGTGSFLEESIGAKYFQPDLRFIQRVNDPINKYKWKAKAYDEFNGKSYLHMRNLLGNVNYMKGLQNQIRENKLADSFLELEIKMSHQSSNNSMLDQVPDGFDWRDVDGINYDSPVRKQGECGSCYAIAAISVMEARIRIRSNNRLKPILSPASVISCSRYNQGCAGGYPFLVGKFGKEFGFVEDNCQPYTETDDKCINFCFHQHNWKVKEYG